MSVRSASSEGVENHLVARASKGALLLEEVRGAMATLTALIAHREHLGDSVVGQIEDILASAEGRLGGEEIVMAVVGEKGAGKTTLVNALVGAPLLPSIDGERNVVCKIRNGAKHDYGVRFRDGTRQKFEEVFFDPSEELTKRLEAAERAIIEATDKRERLKSELQVTTEAVARARADLTGAFATFEAAREEAAGLQGELEVAETTHARLEATAMAQERALPVLARSQPPFWAFWLWLVRSLLAIVYRNRLHAYHTLGRELEQAKSRVEAVRHALDTAAERCAQAEEQLSPSASPAELALVELSQKRAESAQLEARLAALKEEAKSTRDEIERIRAERPARFFEDVRELFDPNSRGKDAEEVDITCPARFLPEDVTLLYAPGLAAKDAAMQRRAWEHVARDSDGCVLVAEVERGISGETREMLRRARDIVPYVVLVLTKMDESFTLAVRRRTGEPRVAVEQAHRIGTRRFAREIGRDPGSVLSLAVAAQEVLKEGEPSGLSRRFADDVKELFRRLRDDRDLILGARTMSDLHECIRGVGVAQQKAECSYQAKLLTLLEQRTPEPNRFRKEQLEAAQPTVRAEAERITRSAAGVARAGMHIIRTHCAERIEASPTRSELRGIGKELEQVIRDGTARVELRVTHHVEERSDAVVRDLEVAVFDALRRRYDIAPDIMRWSNPSIHLDEPDALDVALDLGVSTDHAVSAFERARLIRGLLGAAVGGLVGSLILLGIGTVLGSVLGALLFFSKKFSALKKDCVGILDANLKRVNPLVAERIRASEGSVADAITQAVDASVARASIRYGKWIAAPLEAERAVLVRERELLHELQGLRDRLRRHETRLTEARVAVADASAGLCGVIEAVS